MDDNSKSRRADLTTVEFIRRYFAGAHGKLAPPASFQGPWLEYWCTRGLGPLIFDVFSTNGALDSSEASHKLHSADLTNRVLHSQAMQDLDTLLRLYSRNGIPSVMLKGISISSQFYKQPHHRVMGDMDLLVKTQDLHKARLLAKAAGFVESANVGNCKIPSSHHHLPQLRAPISNFAFEIHSGLFPPTTVADRLSCFSVDQAWKQVIYGTEYDCMVGRFTPQFQFTYTVAHWAADSKWAINIHSIIDSICLLTNPGHKVDWNYVRQAMDQSPWLARVISVLLIYLEDARLAEMPLELRSVVNQARLSLGEFNVRLLHWLIDEFVMRGRSHAAIFLNQRWSAATFWTLMLEPETAGIRIPTAAIGSFLSDRNVFNPLRIIRRASELISIRRN